MRLLLLIVLGGVIAAGCGAPEAADTFHAPLVFEEIEAPAPAGSSLPALHAAPDGALFLSWTETRDSLATLRFARRDGDTWSAPHTIAEGSDWFVNWADFPTLVALGGASLAAHYLAKSGAATYAYDVRLTRSDDGGTTWSDGLVPHRDGTPTEHGFVSLLPAPGGAVRAVWLDGRHTGGGHGHGGAMTLRTATLAPDGTLADEVELDARICDCCQTDAAATPRGAVVVYRDRTEDEIRDISITRLADGTWTAPRPLHDDGWHIEGCPVNGPAVAADGPRLAVAWFTAAADTPRVHLAFSDDEGATFGPPVRIEEGTPVGRVDVVMLPGGDALVSWIERTDSGGALRIRRVAPDGTLAPAVTVTPISPARASGFPRLARTAERVYLAWTETRDDAPPRLHIAQATL